MADHTFTASVVKMLLVIYLNFSNLCRILELVWLCFLFYSNFLFWHSEYLQDDITLDVWSYSSFWDLLETVSIVCLICIAECTQIKISCQKKKQQVIQWAKIRIHPKNRTQVYQNNTNTKLAYPWCLGPFCKSWIHLCLRISVIHLLTVIQGWIYRNGTTTSCWQRFCITNKSLLIKFHPSPNVTIVVGHSYHRL